MIHYLRWLLMIIIAVVLGLLNANGYDYIGAFAIGFAMTCLARGNR